MNGFRMQIGQVLKIQRPKGLSQHGTKKFNVSGSNCIKTPLHIHCDGHVDFVGHAICADEHGYGHLS